MYERADELIERISRGDPDALTHLYDLHRASLLAYIQLLTGDFHLAEEILQDTLLAVWNGADGFDGRASGKTWLYGVARRRARDMLRRKGVELTDASALDTLPSRIPDPEDVAIAAADSDALLAAFEQLSIALREVITLFFVHGLTYQQIAEILVVPVGTVKSRIYSAKRELRSLLGPREVDPS